MYLTMETDDRAVIEDILARQVRGGGFAPITLGHDGGRWKLGISTEWQEPSEPAVTQPST